MLTIILELAKALDTVPVSTLLMKLEEVILIGAYKGAIKLVDLNLLGEIIMLVMNVSVTACPREVF